MKKFDGGDEPISTDLGQPRKVDAQHAVRETDRVNASRDYRRRTLPHALPSAGAGFEV
jgi:hypothetical protein